MFSEIADMMVALLRLEAERIVAAAGVGRVANAEAEAVADIDADMEVLLAGLERRGVAYPPHAVASRYELSGGEYLILQLSLVPHHAPDLLDTLSRIFGGGADSPPRLSWALRLLAPSISDYEGLAQQLERSALVQERLVTLTRLPDGDREVGASLAILELLGLAD